LTHATLVAAPQIGPMPADAEPAPAALGVAPC